MNKIEMLHISLKLFASYIYMHEMMYPVSILWDVDVDKSLKEKVAGYLSRRIHIEMCLCLNRKPGKDPSTFL